MKKRVMVLLLLLVFFAFFFSCAEDPEPVEEAQDTVQEEYPIVLVDHMGREVVIESEVEVIVSLSPSNTETLFALGLEDRVAGVTDYCDFPPEAKEKESVGGFSEPNLEIILTLEPDLVLAGSLHEEVVTSLEERGIPSLALEPQTLEQVYDSIIKVGTAAGVESDAADLLAEIQEQIEGVEEQLASRDKDDRVTVYYELWYDPIMSIGNRSFIHQVITLAGGQNIFADVNDNYPNVSPEVVANENPMVILYPDDHGSAKMVETQFVERPGWSNVAAIENDRMHGVDSDIFGRSGPRVGQAVEKAAALFYPELF